MNKWMNERKKYDHDGKEERVERRKGGREERKEATPVYFIRFSLSSVPGKIQRANTSICSHLVDNILGVISEHRFVEFSYQVSNQLYKYKLGITGQHRQKEPKDEYQSTTGCRSVTYGCCEKKPQHKPHLKCL